MSPEDTDPADEERTETDAGGSTTDAFDEDEEFDDLTDVDAEEGSPKAKAKAARERLEAEADRAVEGFDENVVDLLAWLLDTETRARIYVYLRQHPGSTSEEVADGTGLYPSTVREALAELHEEGKVTRGKRKSAGAGNNPYEYEAIAPSELVNGVVDQVQKQLNTVFNLDRRLGGADESDDESPVTITVEDEGTK
ncbi:winged helix-turn-helix transcriptional regulator [Salinigranum sp. GCM10025319]|uniref:winged helix-turn-helix transcriptional regulator n=1 Tax=Salinigranum sp. GCM10025319 TaxID=3252687 RepID=UPI00361A9C8D